jgi:hypothetical protein
MNNPSKTPNPSGFNPALIAPCGMNCGTCLGYLREKNKCVGCRLKSESKLPSRVNCVILNCPHLAKTESKFCYECGKYPCKRVQQLDKRYRTKYRTSLMGNLERIKICGLEAFVQSEQEKWHCPRCGGTICIHKGFCLNCAQQKKVSNF